MSLARTTSLRALFLLVAALVLSVAWAEPAAAADSVEHCTSAATSWRSGKLCAVATLKPTCCNNVYLTAAGSAFVTGGLGGSGYVQTWVYHNDVLQSSCTARDSSTGEGGPVYTLAPCTFSGFARRPGLWTVYTCMYWDVKNDGRGVYRTCLSNVQRY